MVIQSTSYEAFIRASHAGGSYDIEIYHLGDLVNRGRHIAFAIADTSGQAERRASLALDQMESAGELDRDEIYKVQ